MFHETLNYSNCLIKKVQGLGFFEFADPISDIYTVLSCIFFTKRRIPSASLCICTYLGGGGARVGAGRIENRDKWSVCTAISTSGSCTLPPSPHPGATQRRLQGEEAQMTRYFVPLTLLWSELLNAFSLSHRNRNAFFRTIFNTALTTRLDLIRNRLDLIEMLSVKTFNYTQGYIHVLLYLPFKIH